MKSIMFLGAIAFALSASAQKGWQLGFELAPGYYTMLNDMDKNANPIIIAFDNPELLSAPRAWAGGAKVFYGFTENIGLQTGLRCSWARQDYTHGRGDLPSGGTEIGTISTELSYLQVPLLFSWNTENKSGMRFYVSAGVAPAWLAWFYENYSYAYQSGDHVSLGHVINTSTNRTFYSYVERAGVVELERSSSTQEDERDMYKSFNLFFTTEVGLRVPIDKGWHFNIAFNYYQSLLNPDNIDSYRWENDKYTRNEVPPTNSQIDNPTKYDRPKTTLMTIGISLGLLYQFDW